MRALTVGLFSLVLSTGFLFARDARADRFPDRATRDAVLGCWEVGSGARLELSRYGKHSVWSLARFRKRPRGGPKSMKGLAHWIRERRELEVSCRPRSQHGSFCRVKPEDGKLRVIVVAKTHGKKTRISESFLAERCAAKKAPER